MTFRARVSAFPLAVWIIILGTFLTRFSFFMIWPFLAILLHDKFALNAANIGLILASSGLAGTSLSFFIGNLSDRIGRNGVMLTGIVIYVLAFATLALADSITLYVIAAVMVGMGRAFLEPPGKALISDLVPATDVREMAFHVRYFMLNVGAATGPIIGLYYGLNAQATTFWLTAASYFVYGLGLVWLLPTVRQQRHEQTTQQQQGLRQTFTVLRLDNAFLVLVLANLLIMVTYSQIEGTLVQFLNFVQISNPVQLYTWLITTNALTIITLQFPVLKLVERFSLTTRVKLGVAFTGFGFSLFALTPPDAIVTWITAMFILSLGETILFPTLNLQIDRLAPKHLKGSYFGAAALAGFGFSIGPALGGYLLHQLQSGIIWYGFGALQIIVIGLYFLSKRLTRPDFDALAAQVSN